VAENDTLISSAALSIDGYKIFNELGQGGMATVYLAEQQCFGRKVALKVMSPMLASDPNFSERFLREARIIAGLSHPNIISVYDVGSQNQHHYYAMEYHPGGDLKQRISDGISTRDSLLITKQLALALDHAHNKGYIHRDVKPDNVLFKEDGSLVLTDFGIARATEDHSQLTQVGKIVGTPKYMSPEQAKGEPIDARSDLYSLGIVLYEMLTGEVPFHGEDALSLGIKHIQALPELLPLDVEDFQTVIDRLLAKEPEMRFQSGDELIAALDEVEFYYEGDIDLRPSGFDSGDDALLERTQLQREIEQALHDRDNEEQHHYTEKKRWRSLFLAIILTATATTALLRPDLVKALQQSIEEASKSYPALSQTLSSVTQNLKHLTESVFKQPGDKP
jgi:serine/threonine protein kinase